MLDSFVNYVDKFGPEVLVIQFGFLVIISTLFLWLWFSNRRKYHNLKHAIPANVVKSYLDSIIQNSTALKSSLFRGGGLELENMQNIPSVMPLQNLGGGDGVAVSGAPSTALLEELNQKKAQIAALEAQLSSLQSANKEFENKLQQAQKNLAQAENRIKELEALIAQMKQEGGGGDAALEAELKMVSKERDEIRDRLKEFEIISDDLANLKRLQQENEQLKRSLAAQGGSMPAPAEEEAPAKASGADVADLFEDLNNEAASESGDSQALEDFLSSPDEATPPSEEEKSAKVAADEEVAAPTEEASEEKPEEKTEDSPEEAVEAAAEASEDMAAADDNSEEDKAKSERTPEDLLSEFEKMLG